jgi:hypothetical protein
MVREIYQPALNISQLIFAKRFPFFPSAEESRYPPAGEGDGQLPLLLTHFKESSYQGFLTLEPHLKIAGHSTGFSGPDGMEIAVTALRKVMIMNLGLRDILPELAALLVLTAIYFAIGAWAFWRRHMRVA